MSPNEEHIALAIADIRTKRLPSIRAAAAAYNVPRSTLGDRLREATKPRAVAAQERQLLPPEQEERLVKWILQREACGHPIGRAMLHEMVTFLVQLTGVAENVGHNWVERFLSRHPTIASKIGKKLDISRYEGALYEVISPWFDALKSFIQSHHIHTSDITNMDETGLAIGTTKNTKVLGTSSSRTTFKKSPEDREWVSVIECITADGRALTPLVIFKGESLQSTWFDKSSIPNWLYTASHKGWTSNFIGLQWLKQVYLPSTSPPRGKYRLLLIDGHGSHADVEFMSVCYKNNILAYYLPPHTSHVLQPLDLTCFSPLKGSYRKQLQQVASLDDAAPIKKRRFVQIYAQARQAGLSESNIKSGFRTAGIVPWNPQSVLRRLAHRKEAQPVPQKTPDRPLRPANPLFIYTPQNKRQFNDISSALVMQTPSQRTIRTLVSKTSKLLDHYTYRYAELQAENQRNSALLASLQSRKRTRVIPDSNSLFADIANIEHAQERARVLEAQWKAREPERQAKMLSDRLIEADMTQFMSEWHILQPHEAIGPSAAAMEGSGGVADSAGGRLAGS